MSTISDSSQEASNTAISTSLTPIPSPNIFIKNEDLQPPNVLNTSVDLFKSSTSLLEQAQKRRSSSRSIKRKKFDDELVESSLVKTSRPKTQSVGFPMLSSNVCLPPVAVSPNSASTSSQPPSEMIPVIPFEKRKSRPNPKRIKKQKTHLANLAKDISRWKPLDDLLLILSVQQTNDLEVVHRGVKFSSKFSLRDVQERWYSLLYDATTSKASQTAIKQLSSDVILQAQARALFSIEEEKLISSIPSGKGSIEVFDDLLKANSSVFLPSRTAKALHSHWTQMKQYNLLQDQNVHHSAPVDSLLTFSDTEDLMDDSELRDAKDSALDEETSSVHRRHLQEIKQLENEVPKWQVLVESVMGVSIPDFDSKTLAVLRGRIVRYLIQSREVTFGRSTKDGTVDIDISLEGPAWKISRRQGVIRMDPNGEFSVVNEGKRPIFVDGKPVLTGCKYKLNNNSVIEITVLRFIFIVNQEAISALRNKTNG